MYSPLASRLPQDEGSRVCKRVGARNPLEASVVQLVSGGKPMRILGDLTEKTSTEVTANPDFASAEANRKESLVGEIPLNTVSDPDVGVRRRSGNNGGAGRSHGLEATHDDG